MVREVDTRPEYEHWLGAVYVHEPYRGQGIGALLVKTAAEKASKLGIDDLYLYTRHTETEAWYTKLGWVSLEKLTYQGHPATIMKKLLR